MLVVRSGGWVFVSVSRGKSRSVCNEGLAEVRSTRERGGEFGAKVMSGDGGCGLCEGYNDGASRVRSMSSSSSNSAVRV